MSAAWWLLWMAAMVCALSAVYWWRRSEEADRRASMARHPAMSVDCDCGRYRIFGPHVQIGGLVHSWDGPCQPVHEWIEP